MAFGVVLGAEAVGFSVGSLGSHTFSARRVVCMVGTSAFCVPFHRTWLLPHPFQVLSVLHLPLCSGHLYHIGARLSEASDSVYLRIVGSHLEGVHSHLHTLVAS